MLPYKLFLDDIRTLRQTAEMTNDSSYVEEEWLIVRNYNEFTLTVTDMFKDGYFPLLVSFDHDLGYEHTSYYFNNGGHENPPDPLKADFKEKTGYDCAKWLVDFCIDNKIELPKYVVHSKNPVGKKNIEGYFESYLKQLEK
jgi:hypothetical protein